ncbi:MAG TPA: serine hydrolase domain-containing protein [Blastocatellia bacterium]|nr:serine hydrolase domain-containing protein [Blastocatellia bacterium]
MTNLKNCLIALFLLASVAIAQTTTAEKIDAYLTRLAGFGLTGAVLVAQDGKVILEKGYGWADRKRNLPFTKDTVIDIGSNTKDLTKTAILQLAQNGKLKLGDTLSQFFANVPADKAAITVAQLMEHTAGFGQYSGRDDERITKEDFLQRVFSAPLIAAPGKEENYSNPGYSLLAAIIEKVSGQSYEQYVRDHILTPAGMTTTGYILPKWRDGQLARNYADGEEQPPTLDYPHLPDGAAWNLRGNGGTLSTVGDMYKFHLALQGDKLLAPEFKAKLFDVNAPLMLVGGNGVHFFVYQTEPASRLVILMATTDARVRATEVSRHLTTIARGRELPLPPQLTKLEEATLAKLAGSYQLPSGAELKVTARGDHLFVAGTNEAGFQLMQGNTRGNPELMDKLSAQIKAMLQASANGDYSLTHKAFAAAMPYEQFKTRQEGQWQQRKERLGAFKAVTILSTVPGQGGYVTTARLDYERGADYAQFMWDGGGMPRGFRFVMSAPGLTFYPHSATEFVNYNLTNGAMIHLNFTPQGNGFSVSVQSSTAATTPTKSAAPQLPDTVAGRLVAAYFKAFNSGDEKVMQEFLATHLSPTYLAARPMDERLKIYQRLRTDLGNLTVSNVAEPNQHSLAVLCQTATGKTVELRFEFDDAAPQKLKGLRVELQ